MRRTLIAALCAVLGLLAILAWTSSSAEASGPAVVPIYFYPNDHAPDQRSGIEPPKPSSNGLPVGNEQRHRSPDRRLLTE